MENSKEEIKPQISSDVDQHESPLKEAILVDDSDSKFLAFTEGVKLVCKFVELVGEFFHFREKGTNNLVKVNKHQSIVSALNKINFSPECEIEINCIGNDKFKITKNS